MLPSQIPVSQLLRGRVLVLYKPWCVALLALSHLRWCAGGKHLSALATAFRTDVDKPVGLADNVEIVLDDDDGVATVYELLQHLHQYADILEVQTRGGLVEYIHGLAGVTLRQFRGQLYALTLTAREGGGGLAQLDIAQTYILYALDLSEYVGHVLEELYGLIDGHVEHVGYRLALIAHLQCFTVVALAMTVFARYLYVGQEVHLNGLVAVATTGFAAATLYVERESAWLVATYLGLGQIYKQRTDIAEHAGIGGWVRARCATDRTLVDTYHLIYILNALDAVVRHGALK